MIRFFSALDEAIRPEFISNGYRTSINNHLIIYITSTTTFSDQPKTDTIRSSKQYGVITVGYGATATDQNALQVNLVQTGLNSKKYSRDWLEEPIARLQLLTSLR